MENASLEFRAQALKHLHARKAYERPVRIVSSQGWFLLIMIALFLASVLCWGFWGSIPTWVEGRGILIAQENEMRAIVAWGNDGEIVKILVSSDQEVAPGQVLAHISHPSLEKELRERTDHLAYLKQTYEEQIKEYHGRSTERLDDYAKQKAVLSQILLDQDQQVKHLEDLLNQRKQLLDQKILSNVRYEQTLQEYNQARTTWQQTKLSLVQAQVTFNEFQDSWKKRLLDMDLKIQETLRDVQLLKEKLALYSVLRAPTSGRITGIQKTQGSSVSQGETLMTLTDLQAKVECLIYVDAEQGKQIHTQMTTQITPTYIKREEFGSIKGHVIDVSDLPVNAKRIQAVVQNEELVKSFSDKKVPFEVRVALDPDPKTKSGFAWTSSQGPDHAITLGTLVSARIIVKKQPPISLVLPTLKKLLGVE